MKSLLGLAVVAWMGFYMLRGTISQDTRPAPGACTFYEYHPIDAEAYTASTARYATDEAILAYKADFKIFRFSVPPRYCDQVSQQIANGTFRYEHAGQWKD